MVLGIHSFFLPLLFCAGACNGLTTKTLDLVGE